jgi:hypothetical protein
LAASWLSQPVVLVAGTADQNKAIAQGIVAMYGSYTVDDANKTIIVKFEGSSFATKIRQIHQLNRDT